MVQPFPWVQQMTPGPMVIQLRSIRSTTETEVEEIDMLRNLSVKDTTVSHIRQATEADSVLRE